MRSTSCDRLAGPSPPHPLGTDELGRDVLMRLLAGGRVSLTIGIAAALTAAAIGTLVGLVAGYLGGWTDRVMMRLTDAIIALPLLPLLIVLAALDLKKLGVPAALARSDDISLVRIVALAVLVGWTTAARLVRGATLVTRNRDFVRAARSLGAGVPHILWTHILPNVLAPLIVATTLERRRRDPVGIGAELSRPRHPAAARQLGHHAEQRAGADHLGAAARALSRGDDLPHRDRLQSIGRRAAAALRPARLSSQCASRRGAPNSSRPMPGSRR